MTESIDRALIGVINHHYLFSGPYEAKQKKIALIGERSKQVKQTKLVYKLHHKFGITYKNTTIFTVSDKFKVEDGKHFDFLIGCRPCDAEKIILESATKFHKRLILMPCNCGRVVTKVIKYVRDYSIVTHVDSRPEEYDGGKYDCITWFVLFNTNASLKEFEKR
jgi:hypothetical protein